MSSAWGRDLFNAAILDFSTTYASNAVVPSVSREVTRAIRETGHQLNSSLGNQLLSQDLLKARPSSEAFILLGRSLENNKASAAESARIYDASSAIARGMVKAYVQSEALLAAALDALDKKDGRIYELLDEVADLNRQLTARAPNPPAAPPIPAALVTPPPRTLPFPSAQEDRLLARIAALESEKEEYKKCWQRAEARADHHAEALGESGGEKEVQTKASELAAFCSNFYALLRKYEGKPFSRSTMVDGAWNIMLPSCFTGDVSIARCPPAPPSRPPSSPERSQASARPWRDTT